MRYDSPNCPTCGDQLRGECDLVPGCAEVFQDDSGNFQYTGYTDMFWDGQRNELSYPYYNRKSVKVQCREGHTWVTARKIEAS